MGTRGRKPKPASQQLLAGERADRMRGSGPRTGPALPECPDHLDDLGREAWDEIVPKLADLGVLTELDGHALGMYCVAYSRWRRALEEIGRDGVTTFTDQGSVKANPAVTVATQAERFMTAILLEFGLTPSSRSRVKADSTPRDALADFLSSRSKR